MALKRTFSMPTNTKEQLQMQISTVKDDFNHKDKNKIVR